ncbi:hypothetical protein GOBAR_AA36433 [Gossypium barbadense]|uniref:Uncharacterized protein n=1 Tax=Gossypium barbadense TaxID=3634 RepID=A0A2P5VZL5_GOSBA|nr:hypothetical protein GOBAR_AA36433 [Gossypium barbadense]
MVIYVIRKPHPEYRITWKCWWPHRRRVLESDRFESGGGYSGGRKGSLGHKSYAKRILYLVVAMVMVEQDMAVVENHFLVEF